MTRSRKFLTFGLVAAATTALALAVAVPVSAHSGSLFTSTQEAQFAAVNPVNASLAPLGPVQSFGTAGVEIYEEEGYALSSRYSTTNALITWDHTTGEATSSTPLTPASGFAFNNGVWGLDVTPDGTILAFAEQMLGNDDYGLWVVSIGTDGVVTPRVLLNDLAFAGFSMNSLATNPTDGATYAFMYSSDGSPKYVSIDLALEDHGVPVELSAIRSTLGDGNVVGADFDPAGTLWFYYGAFDAESVLASSTGAFGPGAGAVVSGPAGIAEISNLAYDPATAAPAAAPALPNMGVDASALAAGALALFGAGVITLLIVRRRTA